MDLQAELIADVERQYRANLALLQSEEGQARVRLMQDATEALTAAGFAPHTQAIYNTANHENGALILIVHTRVMDGTSGLECRTALREAAQSIGAVEDDQFRKVFWRRGAAWIEVSTSYSAVMGYRPARLAA